MGAFLLKQGFVEISSYLKNKKPTRCHLLFYCFSYTLNMFRALLCPKHVKRISVWEKQ